MIKLFVKIFVGFFVLFLLYGILEGISDSTENSESKINNDNISSNNNSSGTHSSSTQSNSNFAQTQQQALDEIARIEKVIAQTPEMLRQAWEAGRTQKDTVIDTPYGKVTIKFNLDELIRETYTGDLLDYKLKNRHGEMNGSELRLNNGGSWKNEYPEGMKATIAHELGHYMMDRIRSTPLAPPDKYRAVEDISEIDADAFAMRYIGKTEYIKQLKRESNSQDFIDAVIKRMEEVEREERETLARLRTIANAPDATPEHR